MGGLAERALKKLYGARLGTPVEETVEIHPMGRGMTSDVRSW
jgi:hypothetical protein